MLARLKLLFRDLGRVEKVFLASLVLLFVIDWTAPGSVLAVLATLAVYVSGVWAAIRVVRRVVVKAIWRLRNRLIVAYVFIAVVPIILLAVLVGLGAYMVTGQVASYLVSSELDRRIASLRGPAEALARTAGRNREDVIPRVATFLRDRFPALEIAVREGGEQRYPAGASITSPPAGWKDASGAVVRDGRVYAWAHVAGRGAEVTLMAPLTHELLSGLVPGLGNVYFLDFLDESPQRSGARVKLGKRSAPLEDARRPGDRLPAKYNAADFQVTGLYPLSLSFWNEPDRSERGLLVVQTRVSAVLGTVFGERMDWGEVALALFVGVAVLFLIVEIVSLIIGISLTRTITGAVHELYEGTQKVMQGDFSHRIAVRGKDQLAELGVSFNTMTANLERLIVVAKEKERMQSELEIAREVQGQLFPKNMPRLRRLELTGSCTPARMVSGDYYDFITLPDRLAFAIGDVAGKGISAALLMAAIQSTMRTQLNLAIPAAAAAGNGGDGAALSTAGLVARLNEQLYANTSPEKFATFYFGLYDEASNLLTYTNAGHLPPVLIRDGRPELLEITGTVVGAFPFSSYDEKQVRLAPGDLLVAYTDGVIEPENEYGEMFGQQQLVELLLAHAGRGADEIIARVMEAVRRWTGSEELQDDMTMLIARQL